MSTEPRGEGGRRALEDLLDATRADPELTPSERETTFTFAVDEDVAHIHTEEAAVIRRLLSHDDVRVDQLGVFDGDRRRTLTREEALAELEAGDAVVRLKGALPLRFFVVRDTGRSHDRHADVVSKEVFNK
jgi:hypothetical protein